MTGNKMEKLVKLAQALSEDGKEKLNCVAQGMLLAQTAAEEQPGSLNYSAATDDQAS